MDKGQYFYTQLSEITFIRYVYTQNKLESQIIKKSLGARKPNDLISWRIMHQMPHNGVSTISWLEQVTFRFVLGRVGLWDF